MSVSIQVDKHNYELQKVARESGFLMKFDILMRIKGQSIFKPIMQTDSGANKLVMSSCI